MANDPRKAVEHLDSAKQALARSKVRLDAFFNGLTGFNTAQRDKRLGGDTTVFEVTRQQCDDLYRGDDLGAVSVEALPDEMLRKGWEVVIEGDEDLTEEVNSAIRDLAFDPSLLTGLYWARKDGGSAIFLGADDGTEDLKQPLDLKKVQKLTFLTNLERWELVPRTWYSDPISPKFGRPEIYFMQPRFALPGSVEQAGAPQVINREIHESRLLILEGVPVSRTQRYANQGWGDSVFVRMFEVLRDFNQSWSGIANVLADFRQAVYKLRGLNQMLLSDESDSADTLIKRVTMTDLMRSAARAMVVDAGGPDQPSEEFQSVTASLTGVSDTMEKLMLRLAGAARMPVALLFGQSPTGLNSSDKTGQQWFYEKIASLQKRDLEPVIRAFLKVFFAAKEGPCKGKEPKRWSIRFHPLMQLSPLEEAQRRLAIQQADSGYIADQVLTPEEVAASRFGGAEYSADTTIDMDAREAMDVEPEDRLMPAHLRPPGPGDLPTGGPAPSDNNPVNSFKDPDSSRKG